MKSCFYVIECAGLGWWEVLVYDGGEVMVSPLTKCSVLPQLGWEEDQDEEEE